MKMDSYAGIALDCPKYNIGFRRRFFSSAMCAREYLYVWPGGYNFFSCYVLDARNQICVATDAVPHLFLTTAYSSSNYIVLGCGERAS